MRGAFQGGAGRTTFGSLARNAPKLRQTSQDSAPAKFRLHVRFRVRLHVVVCGEFHIGGEPRNLNSEVRGKRAACVITSHPSFRDGRKIVGSTIGDYGGENPETPRVREAATPPRKWLSRVVAASRRPRSWQCSRCWWRQVRLMTRRRALGGAYRPRRFSRLVSRSCLVSSAVARNEPSRREKVEGRRQPRSFSKSKRNL